MSYGWLASHSAAAPATCGVAIDVPLIVFDAVSLVFHADVMLVPGANRSVQEPKSDEEARRSSMVALLTINASVTLAGEKLHASALLLPEAMA